MKAGCESRPKYEAATEFGDALRKRVADHFRHSGLEPRDDPRIFLKAAVLVAWAVASYWLLVFRAQTALQGFVLAISLALAIGGIGFSVAHDGSHGSCSRRAWINRLMGMSFDLIGASSYFWRWAHNVFHHGYPNVGGFDGDNQIEPFFRLAPHQKRRGFHRFQHLYAWVLYGFLVIKWQYFADFNDLARGRSHHHRVPRPRGGELALLVAGKLFFILWAWIIPLQRHTLLDVVLAHVLASVTLGLVMSTVFQLAHTSERADYVLPEPGTGSIPRDWARLQVEASADFARGNRLLGWYLGGLNYQIEHHLYPGICHTHYPALSRIVEATCAEHGVRYTAFGTLGEAIAAHARWLKRLGSV